MSTVGHTQSKSFVVHVTFLVNALLTSLAWLYFVSHGFTANGIVDGVYEIQAANLSQARLAILPGPLEQFYHDALMYWGQYYFYWGLLPSAGLAGLTRICGRLLAHYSLVFGCLFLFVFFYQRIVARILECASPDGAGNERWLAVVTPLLTWLLLCVIPYPHHFGWFFGRFAVYEQQIVFGLALALPGLYFLITGIEQRRPGPVALASLFLVLASWTRVTWFPLALVVLAAAGVLIWKWKKVGDPHSSPSRDVLILAVSLIMALGLLLVNYVRFDAPLDFGVRYQNPTFYVYFRNLKMFFSPLTKLWNAVFNMSSYFAPPGLVEDLGLISRSFSQYEGFPPSFFFFNPQFLPLAALFPLALYKTIRARNALAWWLGILAAATLYLNVILGLFGTFVILRYFVEFYYLLILVFLGVLLSLVRPRYALPVFVLMLGLYVPETVRDFRSWSPELRTAEAANALRITSPKGTTPFIQARPVWPIGSFSGSELPRTSRYAIMGLDAGADGTLMGKDIFAVYVVPRNSDDISSPAMLEIRGMRALNGKGEAFIFLENRLLTRQSIDTSRVVDIRCEVPFALNALAPYQVMVIFLPDGQTHLPGRTRGVPVVALREVALTSSAHPEDAKALPVAPTGTKGTYTRP